MGVFHHLTRIIAYALETGQHEAAVVGPEYVRFQQLGPPSGIPGRCSRATFTGRLRP